MKREASILLTIALAFIASCSGEAPPSAIVRVTLGEPPQLKPDEYAVDNATGEFTSYDFCKHVDEKLGLSKLWGLSDTDVFTRLLNAIRVKAGNEPGLVVITCKGQDHDLAVKIVNELCVCVTEKETEISHNYDPPQKIHFEVVQPAK